MAIANVKYWLSDLNCLQLQHFEHVYRKLRRVVLCRVVLCRVVSTTHHHHCCWYPLYLSHSHIFRPVCLCVFLFSETRKKNQQKNWMSWYTQAQTQQTYGTSVSQLMTIHLRLSSSHPLPLSLSLSVAHSLCVSVSVALCVRVIMRWLFSRFNVYIFWLFLIK